MPGARQRREARQGQSDHEPAASTLPPQDLAAFATHELRGPINTLQAFLSILLREQPGPLNELQRDFVSSMYSISRRLERLADDIHIMLVEEARLSIHPHEVDGLALVEECERELAPIAAGHNVSISVHESTPGQWHLVVDPVRLTQIVINLLENAIRNSVGGSLIKVRLARSRSRFLLVFENEVVEEPTQEELDNWFLPYVRGIGAETRAPRGSGLGLAVVSHLVIAVKGRIITRAHGNRVTIAIQLPSEYPPEVPLE
jgi:signal transduction histidine kinase